MVSRYQEVIDAAIEDMAANGFSSVERLAYWERKIREAADASMTSSAQMEGMLRDALAATFKRLIASGRIAKNHPGIGRWNIEKVRPALRAELDRRILASANLIRLNREQRKAETIRRFSGWATSLPPEGVSDVNKREEVAKVRKPLARLKFEERRVLTDQGHKLTGALNNIVAVDNGAIALVWRSHWRQPNYDFREDHKERDLHVYGIRGAWAFEQGLAKKGENGWYDEITAVAEEPFCRCWAVYVYTMRELERLAPDMITAKGWASIKEARAKVAAMS